MASRIPNIDPEAGPLSNVTECLRLNQIILRGEIEKSDPSFLLSNQPLRCFPIVRQRDPQTLVILIVRGMYKRVRGQWFVFTSQVIQNSDIKHRRTDIAFSKTMTLPEVFRQYQLSQVRPKFLTTWSKLLIETCSPGPTTISTSSRSALPSSRRGRSWSRSMRCLCRFAYSFPQHRFFDVQHAPWLS